jgi:hypothetical protein
MKKYLDNLKEQSPEKKQNIIRMFALVTTACIVAIYIGLKIIFPETQNQPLSSDLIDGTQNIFETGIDQLTQFDASQNTLPSQDSLSEEETQAFETNPLLQGVLENNQDTSLPSTETPETSNIPLYDESNPYSVPENNQEPNSFSNN